MKQQNPLLSPRVGGPNVKSTFVIYGHFILNRVVLVETVVKCKKKLHQNILEPKWILNQMNIPSKPVKAQRKWPFPTQSWCLCKGIVHPYISGGSVDIFLIHIPIHEFHTGKEFHPNEVCCSHVSKQKNNSSPYRSHGVIQVTRKKAVQFLLKQRS